MASSSLERDIELRDACRNLAVNQVKLYQVAMPRERFAISPKFEVDEPINRSGWSVIPRNPFGISER
jgi:hypothetical protein